MFGICFIAFCNTTRILFIVLIQFTFVLSAERGITALRLPFGLPFGREHGVRDSLRASLTLPRGRCKSEKTGTIVLFTFLLSTITQASLVTALNKKKDEHRLIQFFRFCGERGIRTPGASQHAGFQDRCNRPLYHLSECGLCDVAAAKVQNSFQLSVVSYQFFVEN